MKTKTTFWQKVGLHDWLLKRADTTARPAPGVTPDAVYTYMVQQFGQSISTLSFGNRIVFYHEHIIALNADDYQAFMDDKKGLFGLIVQESVQQFYAVLDGHRAAGKKVLPAASKWVFRFVSHPDYARGDLGFIGKLLPGASQKEDNLRITFIPRQTGIAQTFDINPEILRGFNFYSDGYYEVPYNDTGQSAEMPAATAFARLEATIPDKQFQGRKLEFLMKEEDISICGSDETRSGAAIFRIPSEWVNSPHLRLRFSRSEKKFYASSFGEKTILNESLMPRSDAGSPVWTEVPINSKLVLNGIISINLFNA